MRARGATSGSGMRALVALWLLLALGLGGVFAWAQMGQPASRPAVAKLTLAARVPVSDAVPPGPVVARVALPPLEPAVAPRLPASQPAPVPTPALVIGPPRNGAPPTLTIGPAEPTAPSDDEAALARAQGGLPPPPPARPLIAQANPPPAADPIIAAGAPPAAPVAAAPPPPAPASTMPAPAAEQQSTTLAQATARPPARPAPRRTGQPPWVANARAFDANDRRGRIAIVFTDMGLSAAAAEVAIRHLPPEITLAFNSYAPSLPQLVARARAEGHEVLLNMPMEPNGYPTIDPGPQTLLTKLTARENIERLETVLTRVNGYVGINSHLGSRFTQVAEAMKPVMEALNERGLMYLDTRDTTRSVGAALASELRVPRAINDRIIDLEPTREAIDARLAELEKIARESGTAVAMAHPVPVTFERLTMWIPTLPGKGLTLAPITAAANRQNDR